LRKCAVMSDMPSEFLSKRYLLTVVRMFRKEIYNKATNNNGTILDNNNSTTTTTN